MFHRELICVPLYCYKLKLLIHGNYFYPNFVTGITIGAIGPKFSIVMNGNDNGFLLFDHVRIPLNHMLMGLAKVRDVEQFTLKEHFILSSVAYRSFLCEIRQLVQVIVHV